MCSACLTNILLFNLMSLVLSETPRHVIVLNVLSHRLSFKQLPHFNSRSPLT